MVMVGYNTLNNNQWLLDWFKTQALTIEEIDVKNVSSKKKWHLAIDFNNIFLVVINDNNVLELQSL
jgi:hypothetical protein